MSSQILNVSKDEDSIASMGKVRAFDHPYSKQGVSAKENDTLAQ